MVGANLVKSGTTWGVGGGTQFCALGVEPAIGGNVGGKAAVAVSEEMETRSLNNQAVKAQKQMEKATKLGTKLNDVGK